MTLLLDSNALLWLLAGNSSLGPLAHSRIVAEQKICVSDVSLFEITIKAARMKLVVPNGLAAIIDGLQIIRTGISDAHLDAMKQLPFHHHDPFERYLIAQSLVESIPIVTANRSFVAYGVKVIDARL